MTGFARAEGGDGDLRWTWEIKSVNGRNLDIRVRVPTGFEMLEPAARSAIPERVKRGNVAVGLVLTRGQQPARARINRELLDQVIVLAEEVRQRLKTEPPRAEGLLAVRGVVEPAEEEDLPEEKREERYAKMAADFTRALTSLAHMRQEEGARLAAIVGHQLDDIERHCAAAAASAAAQPAALQARLKQQVEMLLGTAPALPEERLAQELALLITKADVREELDRLGVHIAAARKLVKDGGAVGRKFDFLCQEFNREANTLCSKSADSELTAIGLELKASIDQLREQVQNIE
ncbi:MAG TPA: YicC/YloC family endoribonuclease [Dongiaceae bacterium]|jgi:uncharacterized protein (TIGR00255 family)